MSSIIRSSPATTSCRIDGPLFFLAVGGNKIFNTLSFYVQKIALVIQTCFQNVLAVVKELCTLPGYLYMARKEVWDPGVAFLEDRRIKSEWARLFTGRKKLRMEQKTPKMFLADARRADYYVGQVRSQVEHNLLPGENLKEGLRGITTLNANWSRFLKTHIDPQLKKPLSYPSAHLLRYQLQDIAHQRLFMLSDVLFPKMYLRYDASGYLVGGNADSLEYQLVARGSHLVLQCNTVFRIYKQATSIPIGYDALSIEVAIDLATFNPDQLLTRQPKGCLTGSVVQRGFSTVR